MQKQLVLWKIHRPSGFSFNSSILLTVPHYLTVAILLDPNSHWWHVNRFLDQGPFHSLGLGYANLLSGLPWRTMEWWGWNLQNRWIGATVRMCLPITRCLILSRALSCSNHENLAQFLLWGGTGFANVMSVGLRYSTIINTRILLQYRSAQYTPNGHYLTAWRTTDTWCHLCSGGVCLSLGPEVDWDRRGRLWWLLNVITADTQFLLGV